MTHTFLVLVTVGLGHGVYRKLYTLIGGNVQNSLRTTDLSPYICNVCEFLETNYCIPARWLTGPLQKSFPPWLKPLVTPLTVGGGTFRLAPGRHFPMSGPCCLILENMTNVCLIYGNFLARNYLKWQYFWQYWFHAFFAIHIFSMLFSFLNLTIKKRTVLWEWKCVPSVGKIHPLFSLDQWFSKWADLPLGGDFKRQWDEKTKLTGNAGAKQHKGAKMHNHLSITELSSVAYSNLSVKFTGSPMCLATVWIIFTRILNIILASQLLSSAI